MKSDSTLLLVANYDSGVGYAWWLMESFWVLLAEQYHHKSRVILVYPTISSLPPTIANAPLQVIEFDFTRQGFRQIVAQCKFLFHNQVQTIYFSDMPTWHWRYAFYRLAGVKILIVHDHTPGMRTSVTGIKGGLKRFLHRLPWIVVDGAIGATEFVRQRFINVYGMNPERCYAAPNGLPPVAKLIKAIDLRQLFEIPTERKILIMTGRAHRYKGVNFVSEVISCLPASDRNKLHFVFVGDGPDLENYKNTACKLGLAGFCTFAGYRNDVFSFLAGADIAIHPSRGEVGYSLSILEYMRAGLPLVVPDNPSVCEATEDGITGIVYPEGDVQAASEALCNLVNDDSLRIQMGKNARLMSRRYSLEETHRSLLEAVSKIDWKRNLMVSEKQK